MKDQTRRAIAYVIGRIVNGKQASSVFDQSSGKNFGFSGDISLTRIAIRDQEGGIDISGTGGSGMFTLTHPGNGRPVSLKINGNSFEGFDYGTAKRYRGTVSGNTISLFDEQVAKDFVFTV